MLTSGVIAFTVCINIKRRNELATDTGWALAERTSILLLSSTIFVTDTLYRGNSKLHSFIDLKQFNCIKSFLLDEYIYNFIYDFIFKKCI